MKLRELLAIFWLFVSTSVAAATTQYHIDLSEPGHHIAQVEMVLPQIEPGPLQLALPNWRTGRYQILPMADGIRAFEAVDSQGRPLAWQKVRRATWQVQVTEPGEVRLRYQVHATELGDRSRHIDDSHAYLDASGVLMYDLDGIDRPLEVALTVPKGWRSVSGMRRLGPHRFAAKDYHVLVDSPIETGIHQDFQFQVRGRDYELVIWGEGNYDAEQMVADLKALVEVGGAYYDHQYPYDYYLFIVHATDGARGATEHLNSTVIQRPRWRFAERADYLSFLATAAHELIHTWNVKAYRPAGLVPYRYQQDNYTPLLWFAEGGTSYLQNRWLLQAGLMTPEEFLADLAKRLNSHLNRPGRDWQSVAQASFDGWIARGGDYGLNHSVSFYSEGYLASWALDHFIMGSRDGVGIQALHQSLYQQDPLPGSYDSARLQQRLTELVGRDPSVWWSQHIDGPLQLDLAALLAQTGLQLQWPEEQEWDLGLTTEKDSGKIVQVRRDGPAWQAGLTVGDELVAVDGRRWLGSDWPSLLAQAEAGQQVMLSLFRRQRLMELPLTLQQRPKGTPKIVPLESATEAQRQRFALWSGVAWPFEQL
ncbi:M61 family metallopeptidase [Ferrimonas marina]|uniref:Predicted metalloprotease, contains C-terminal PDZ domain n=1 Tax=Ferrimonas marina TaxID=299255 RepID=A0A1M5SBC3_9GAMM|nr:PDZ domain-containing protein [Ferrimonas marina]SHH35588.1 Predicted metalloprotease, contains C-terminal PDZ domain [Ferrimonas marina]